MNSQRLVKAPLNLINIRMDAPKKVKLLGTVPTHKRKLGSKGKRPIKVSGLSVSPSS